MIKNNFNKFQERLEELMQENNLSRLKLSKLLDINSSTINGYFNNNYYPQIDICLKISKHFNCSLDYLFGLSDDKTTKYKVNSNLILTNFVNNLDRLIKEHNLSISKTMSALNMSEYNYFRWKKGKFPKTINLISIAKYFDTSIDELLGKTHETK